MTDLLYQTDSYLRDFDTTITGVDETNHGVILARTVFVLGVADNLPTKEPCS